MLGGADVGKQCRTADIMADAAYAILSRPKDFTGHFLVDEDVLRGEGLRDFEQYAVQPGDITLHQLMLTYSNMASPSVATPHSVMCSSWWSLIGRQVTLCYQTSSLMKHRRAWRHRWSNTVNTADTSDTTNTN